MTCFDLVWAKSLASAIQPFVGRLVFSFEVSTTSLDVSNGQLVLPFWLEHMSRDPVQDCLILFRGRDSFFKIILLVVYHPLGHECSLVVVPLHFASCVLFRRGGFSSLRRGGFSCLRRGGSCLRRGGFSSLLLRRSLHRSRCRSSSKIVRHKTNKNRDSNSRWTRETTANDDIWINIHQETAFQMAFSNAWQSIPQNSRTFPRRRTALRLFVFCVLSESLGILAASQL